MVISLERVAISSIKHKTLHQLSTYIQYRRDVLCMFNFTFMPDVGMGYVSLDPYTLFECFLAWPSLHTLEMFLLSGFFVQAYLSVYM